MDINICSLSNLVDIDRRIFPTIEKWRLKLMQDIFLVNYLDFLLWAFIHSFPTVSVTLESLWTGVSFFYAFTLLGIKFCFSMQFLGDFVD